MRKGLKYARYLATEEKYNISGVLKNLYSLRKVFLSDHFEETNSHRCWLLQRAVWAKCQKLVLGFGFADRVIITDRNPNFLELILKCELVADDTG